MIEVSPEFLVIEYFTGIFLIIFSFIAGIQALIMKREHLKELRVPLFVTLKFSYVPTWYFWTSKFVLILGAVLFGFFGYFIVFIKPTL